MKDTGVFDDGVSCSLVKHHLIEDVDNLTHKLVILLLGYMQQTENMEGRLGWQVYEVQDFLVSHFKLQSVYKC